MINEVVQKGMQNYKNITDYQFYTYQLELTRSLEKEFFRYSNFADIQLRMKNGQVFFNLGFELYDEQKIEEALAETEASSNNMHWTYVTTNRGGRIVFCRWINSIENTDRKLGYMLIVVDEKVFANQVYKHVDLGEGSDIFILDKVGTVISSISSQIQRGAPYSNSQVANQVIDNHSSRENHIFTAEIGQNKSLVISSWIPKANWYLVGTIPYRFILSESLEIRQSIILICLLTLLISVAIAWFIYLSIANPMKRLLEYAQGIRRGKLNTTINDQHKDEMGTLSININYMVEQLTDLIKKVKVEQTAKREAELKMLQAQINPHFLFNTLNSLKWTAMLQGNQTLTDGMNSLSKLLENTILNKGENITIEQEIGNLMHYATIQRLRYGDSFVLKTEIDEGLKSCIILKFILQPIVENSIIHATDGEDKQIEIKVRVQIKDELLLIQIKDNGKGFDMNAIRSGEKQYRKLSGIGISNVDERIRLNFGEGYGLTTESIPDEGTTTWIRMPVIRVQEGKSNV